jgi:hypothetical protein
MLKGTLLIVVFTLLSVAAAVLLPALPQPPEYHDFADQRSMLGVPNFVDVASNAGFLVVGLAGLFIVARRRDAFEHPAERWPYALFFIGVALTAAGSAYYHLAPDNERLFWDRLPMTIAFMSLIAAQITERISVRAGLALLAPMLLAGVASVGYWIVTERAGAGNVMPYVVLQAYAVAALLLVALTQPSRYTRGADLYWVFAGYVAAKALELLDHHVFGCAGLASGHSLKHLVAALAGLVVCRMLLLREPLAFVPNPEIVSPRDRRQPCVSKRQNNE